MNAANILTGIITIVPSDFLLERGLSFLNCRSISTQLPDEVKGVYSEEKHQQSQEYKRANCRFELVTSSLKLVVLLAMLADGVFAFIDGLDRGGRRGNQNPALVNDIAITGTKTNAPQPTGMKALPKRITQQLHPGGNPTLEHLGGYKFRRQHSIGPYILDFYSPSASLAIELDGDSHFTDEAIEYDRHRTAYLNALHIKVLKLLSTNVDEDLMMVGERILAEIIDDHTEQTETP